MSARGAAYGALGVVLGVGLWWAAAAAMGPLLLATPWAVARVFLDQPGALAEATLRTAASAGAGLLAACALGGGAAVAGWWSPGVRQALVPYAVALQVLPIVAIAPLLVVWFGYGPGVAVVTASIAAFFPVYAGVETGLRAPLQEWVDLFRLYRAPRWRELWHLRLPAALPAVFAGVRTAAGLSVIGAIVGEFVGSMSTKPSLGYLVVFGARSARTDLCFAAIVCAGGVALAVSGVVTFLERRAIGRWYGA